MRDGSRAVPGGLLVRRRLIGVCVERLELGRRMERDRYGFKLRIPPAMPR
ncbi:MAG: hypothetical protein QGH74_04735 [Candidatus Brocadiia bacterium]|nr:hypothetical protein [Candidatus Brocadiia bacterium]